MKLTVKKLPEPESCRGIVRVGEAMNISPGDYIVIAGKKSTCAKAMEGWQWCSEHAGENADAEMIWMGISPRQKTPG